MPYKQGWETLVNNPLFHHRNNNIQQATLHSGVAYFFSLPPSLYFPPKTWKLRGKVVTLRQIRNNIKVKQYGCSYK